MDFLCLICYKNAYQEGSHIQAEQHIPVIKQSREL